MKATTPQAAFDHILTQPQRLQLPPRHHPMLPASKVCNLLIRSTRLL